MKSEKLLSEYGTFATSFSRHSKKVTLPLLAKVVISNQMAKLCVRKICSGGKKAVTLHQQYNFIRKNEKS
jgi:hypothetical protein